MRKRIIIKIFAILTIWPAVVHGQFNGDRAMEYLKKQVEFGPRDPGNAGHLKEYFLGSRYFAENKGDYNPRYDILLDMVGDANLSLPKEQFSHSNLPHIVNKIWSLANSMGYYTFEDRVGIPVNDNHVALMKHGIPCIDIIDFEYPDKTHRYWHTLEDTPDKCSAASLATVGQVMLEVIYMEY